MTFATATETARLRRVRLKRTRQAGFVGALFAAFFHAPLLALVTLL